MEYWEWLRPLLQRQGASSEILLYATCLRNLKQIIIPNESRGEVNILYINVDKYFPMDWCDRSINTRNYELSKDVSIATYGYVITAHKSQGSQWEKVFVHQDAFRNNPRWLYTAVTRAEKELTLISESSSQKRTWDQITQVASITAIAECID